MISVACSKLLRAPVLTLAVFAALALGGDASAAPPKRSPVKPAASAKPWVFSPIPKAPPVLVPVDLRARVAPSSAPRARSITARLRAGDPSSERTITLSLGPVVGDVAEHAFLEIGGPRGVQTTPIPVSEPAAAVLASLELVDLDFDGWLDVRVLRERGAKWATHTARLFDPRSQGLVDGEIPRKLASLPNVEVDAEARLLVSRTIGPADPSFAAYRPEGGDLALVRSCVFRTELGAAARGTLVVTENGRERRFAGVELPRGFPERCELGAR